MCDTLWACNLACERPYRRLPTREATSPTCVQHLISRKFGSGTALSPCQEPKKGINIENLGRKPPSQTPPPPKGTLDPRKSLCLGPLFPSIGIGRNTVSRVLFRRRELTEFCGKLGEFCQKLGEFAFAHK